MAEILGDNRPIVGLPCVQISLGCLKVRGSSGLKRAEIGPENQFFEKVPYRYDGEIFLYRTKMVPRGPRLNKKKFSFGGVFWVFGRVETQNDMLCVRILYVMIFKYMSLNHIYVLHHIYVSETYIR